MSNEYIHKLIEINELTNVKESVKTKSMNVSKVINALLTDKSTNISLLEDCLVDLISINEELEKL